MGPLEFGGGRVPNSLKGTSWLERKSRQGGSPAPADTRINMWVKSVQMVVTGSSHHRKGSTKRIAWEASMWSEQGPRRSG